MQQALQTETLVDQAVINAIPALQPLLGHRIEIIAIDKGQNTTDRIEAKLSFEEFLKSRLEWPKDRPPVTLDEMDEAIVQGALASANL